MNSFTDEQWKLLAERFNKQSFTGKLIILKNNPDLFCLEYSDYNFFLRLNDEQAQWKELDRLFEFSQQFSDKEMQDVFKLIGINLK